MASESELRRQSGKQFLQVVEQLRERAGEAAERSARDLTDAVGQLNLRISRIYDDVDNLVKVRACWTVSWLFVWELDG